MALVKKPVTGMKDILPEEMQLRDYVINVIKDTYRSFGFTPVDTPYMEHIENLCSKQGGENEKLIFKVLKRGEKLKLESAECEADLVDMGLRYDLTLPLARFYANHANSLPSPFKALQIGNVFRADRPQRGRYRQFTQCDIDILGEPTNLSEIELILATTTTLGKLGFRGFEIRINARGMLKAMAVYSGFPEDSYESIFITLDKMDKIGLDGVAKELEENGFAKESVQKYLDLFRAAEDEKDSVRAIEKLSEQLDGFLDDAVRQDLLEIINSVEQTKAADFQMIFDPTLVRGMGYYTGTIFEIAIPEFGGSCGGGGRYDKMIGNFTGNDVPACGFSIGFERIILLLMEQKFQIPSQPKKTAYLIEKNYPAEKLCDIIKKAQEARKEGQQILVVRMNKNKKFQKEKLAAEGYDSFEEFYNRSE